MALRSLWKRLGRLWIGAGLAFTVIFVTWSVLAYRATPDARAAAQSDGRVRVSAEKGVVRYSATGATAIVPVGLVFFPGALVEPEAYAPLCRALAEAGFPVILVPLPRRGVFGGAEDPSIVTNTMNAVHEDERAVKWVLAGHSKGAVVATRLAYNLAAMGANSITGLILIGTTHPRDVDLSSYRFPITKIVGTKDGIAPVSRSEANRRLLPLPTTWVSIEGGNHSQFGWYGFQPMDHFASISRDEQHHQMINAIIDALRRAGQPPQAAAISPN